MNKENLREELVELLSEENDPETVKKIMNEIIVGDPLLGPDIDDGDDCGGCWPDEDIIEKRDLRSHQIKQRFDHHKNGKMNMVYKLWKNRNK